MACGYWIVIVLGIGIVIVTVLGIVSLRNIQELILLYIEIIYERFLLISDLRDCIEYIVSACKGLFSILRLLIYAKRRYYKWCYSELHYVSVIEFLYTASNFGE